MKKDLNKILLSTKTKIDILENMKYLDEDIVKIKFSFKNEKNVNIEIKIFFTDIILKNSNNINIVQYFMDSTYKILPKIGEYKALITLLGYNIKVNTFVQSWFIFIIEETKEVYKKFLYLKINYGFSTKYITLDFPKAEEKVVFEVFYNTKKFLCFFHLVKYWWNKLNKLGLKNKILEMHLNL